MAYRILDRGKDKVLILSISARHIGDVKSRGRARPAIIFHIIAVWPCPKNTWSSLYAKTIANI